MPTKDKPADKPIKPIEVEVTEAEPKTKTAEVTRLCYCYTDSSLKRQSGFADADEIVTIKGSNDEAYETDKGWIRKTNISAKRI